MTPHPSAYVEAGHARQHEIKYDDARMEGTELLRSLFICSGGEKVIPLTSQRQTDNRTGRGAADNPVRSGGSRWQTTRYPFVTI